MPSEHDIFASSSALERDFDYFACCKVNSKVIQHTTHSLLDFNTLRLAFETMHLA